MMELEEGVTVELEEDVTVVEDMVDVDVLVVGRWSLMVGWLIETRQKVNL